jgi:hypothetical protein
MEADNEEQQEKLFSPGIVSRVLVPVPAFSALKPYKEAAV